MPAEFDNYAEDYSELLRDPIRDKFAGNTEFFHRRKAILIERHLKQRNFPLASSSWLDVGCGKGELLALGRHWFARAVGCDPSKEMHRDASAEIQHQSSTTALPFPDQSHDFITAVCVFHHVEEQDRLPLTREIYRVLRPGGVMCMIEHNPFNPVTQLIVKRTPVDANARLLTASQAKSYMRRSGFVDAGCPYFLYLPEKWYAKMGSLENLLTQIPLGGQYAAFGQKARH
jgi:ubiquinone/menaquinone biosynthesis C-methylase UbiE